jgi:hypothetical protein
MKLQIRSFADVGIQDKERLIVGVLSDLDIGGFAVFCSHLSSTGSPTSGRKSAYWFPDRGVKQGDLVVLYTKKGKTSTKELESGHTAHFFYWGLGESIWTEQNSAVLLEIKDWIHKAP